MSPRFGAARAALPLLALALAGCAGGSSGTAAQSGPSASAPGTAATTPAAGTPAPTPTAATSETVMRIAERIAYADRAKPYSARLTMRSLIGGRLALVMKGRINLNGSDGAPMAGRVTLRTMDLGTSEKPIAVEEILTRKAYFVRRIATTGKPAGPWKRIPNGGGNKEPFPDLTDYTRLVLLAGPAAVKGEEQQGGVPTTRLSGRIETEQIRKVEPDLYDRLRTASVKGFECDIWIDADGRTVRLEQWLRMQGNQVHNIMTLSRFRDPLTVNPPTS